MTDDQFDAVFNTHHHADHTSGNIRFKNKTRKIIAHTNSQLNQQKAAEQKSNLPDVLLPDTTFSDQYRIKIGSENISCHYFGPAHTNGDAIVHLKIAMWPILETLFSIADFPTLIKAPEPAFAVGSAYTMLCCITLIRIPSSSVDMPARGYDVILKKEDIKAFQNYLSQLLAFAEKNISNGVTLDALKKNTYFIPGAEQWLEMA